MSAQTITISQPSSVPTNKLAIYLLVGKRTPKLEEDQLEPDPILSDGDFAAYNTNTHQIAISAEGARRLSKKLMKALRIEQPQLHRDGISAYEFQWADTSFVLEASGERIYRGVLSTYSSSMGWLNTPLMRTFSLDMPADYTNRVVFDISFDGSPTEFGIRSRPDPRADPRVIAAIRSLSIGNNSTLWNLESPPQREMLSAPSIINGPEKEAILKKALSAAREAIPRLPLPNSDAEGVEVVELKSTGGDSFAGKAVMTKGNVITFIGNATNLTITGFQAPDMYFGSKRESDFGAFEGKMNLSESRAKKIAKDCVHKFDPSITLRGTPLVSRPKAPKGTVVPRCAFTWAADLHLIGVEVDLGSGAVKKILVLK